MGIPESSQANLWSSREKGALTVLMKKSLAEEFKKALGRVDLTSKERLVIGRVDDFDKDELAGAIEDENFKYRITCLDDQVLMTSVPSGLHERITSRIAIALLKLVDMDSFDLSTGTVMLYNGEYCNTVFGKDPDFVLTPARNFWRERLLPGIVGEVVISHEDLDMALKQASIYLSKNTHIQLVFITIVDPTEENFNIRLLVCSRLPSYRLKFLTEEEIMALGKKKKSWQSKWCRLPTEDPETMTKEALEKTYKLKIIHDTGKLVYEKGEIEEALADPENPKYKTEKYHWEIELDLTSIYEGTSLSCPSPNEPKKLTITLCNLEAFSLFFNDLKLKKKSKKKESRGKSNRK